MAGKPRINWVNYGIFIVNKNKAIKSAHLALALNETIKSENGFVPCNVLVYTAKMLGKELQETQTRCSNIAVQACNTRQFWGSYNSIRLSAMVFSKASPCCGC